MDEAARQAEQARIAEEAANWLEKIERTIDKEEAQSLRAWLKLKSHREAIVERCKRWHGPEILAVLGELIPLESFADRVERQYGRILLAIILGVTGIATITVLSAVSRTLPTRDAHGNPLHANKFIRTAVGEQKTIKLPDGGSIVLNTATGVYLIFEPSSRHVTLLAGEAAFNAKYDPARPFTVFANGRRFEVLDGDARFNLRKTAREQAELTVVEGNVRANNARMGSLSPALIRARVRSGEHTFEASEGGTVGPGWQSPWKLPPEEIRRRVAWQSGQIVLHEEYLEDALREIERYTPLRFEFAQQELSAARLSATFKVGDLEAVRQHLRDRLKIGSRQSEAGTIVLIPLSKLAPPGTPREHIDCLTNDSCRRLDDTVDVRL
jgi:transmembrane sensor